MTTVPPETFEEFKSSLQGANVKFLCMAFGLMPTLEQTRDRDLILRLAYDNYRAKVDNIWSEVMKGLE